MRIVVNMVDERVLDSFMSIALVKFVQEEKTIGVSCSLSVILILTGRTDGTGFFSGILLFIGKLAKDRRCHLIVRPVSKAAKEKREARSIRKEMGGTCCRS